MSCITDEDLCALIEGRLDDQSPVHAHISECPSCLEMCAALGRSLAPVAAALAEGQRIGRYVLGRRLGQGGMGVVFEARDTRLQRTVALKFVSGHIAGEPQALARFSREARAAGALDHPNVCAVLDVVEDPACPYLVLALADGENLRERLRRGALSAAEALPILTQITAGLAAAHAAGIVHRDMKSSNVMLSERGEVKILDFGLARLSGSDSETLTRTGDVVGTVAYMAPEQHRGEPADARADVWAVGVIGWELLSAPPFSGATAASLAAAAMADEPTPLPPSVPAGLAAVLGKCLEKDPARRYPSAAELSQEFARLTAGHAVEAKPARPLLRRMRRRWRALVVAALVPIAVGTVAGVLIGQRRAANQRAQVAEQVGRRVQEMRTRMRNAYLMPVHDITADRRAVRQIIAEVEATRATLGDEGRGPIEYALGEGYLTLNEPAAALPHFAAAWAAGERGANLEISYGLTLGQMYIRALADVIGMPVGPERDAARKKAEKERRDPAIVHLRSGAPRSEMPADYIEALIARYERDFPRAAKLAHEAFAKAPLFYEAGQVEADALSRISDMGFAKDRKLADEMFDKARAVYRPVIEIARSDPQPYRARADATILRAVRLNGAERQALYDAASADLDVALRIDRGDSNTLALAGELRVQIGEQQQFHGQDPRKIIREGIALLEEAVGIDQTFGRPHEHIANAWSILADDAILRGEDPRPAFEKSLASAKRAIAVRPNADRYGNTALTLLNFGAYLARRGADPTALYKEAMGLAEAAEALHATDDPDQALRRKGAVYQQMAEWDLRVGKDPLPSLARSDEVFDKATSIDASQSLSYTSRAWNTWLRARWLLGTGGDATALPARMLEQARAGAERDPSDYWSQTMLARGHVLAGELALGAGRDPSASLAQVAKPVAEALKRAGNQREPQQVAVLGELVAAHWAHHGKGEAGAALDRAMRAAEAALAIDKQDGLTYALIAEIHRRRAEWLGRRAEVQAGLAAANRALELSKDLPEARLVRAALLGADRTEIVKANPALKGSLTAR